MLSLTGTTVTPYNLQDCHAMKNKGKVIIKFKDRKHKNKVIFNWKELKAKREQPDDWDFGWQFGASFLINDSMCFENQCLMVLAIKRCWQYRCWQSKGDVRNFTKFIGKQPYQSLFFHEIAGLRPGTLLKERLWHRCLPVNFVKFVRTPIYIEHLWWLLPFLVFW